MTTSGLREYHGIRNGRKYSDFAVLYRMNSQSNLVEQSFVRMGIPYREKNICIISVAMDAPEDEISALSGKIGRLSGISTKTAYAKI